MARIVEVASLDDERLDVFARLTEHQLRNGAPELGGVEGGVFVAESRMVVEVALEAGVEPLAFLVDERDVALSAYALSQAADDVPAYVLPHDQVSRLTGFRLTRGLLCACRRPRELALSEALDGARHVAVLEDLVDVANVGALFRNAAALGVDAVIVSPRCADPLSRRALRVSMGCALKLPWARATEGQWPAAALGQLRTSGFAVYALALERDALPLDDPRLRAHERRALVFGSEGPGLTRATLDCCDRSAIIPMSHGVDSLNVAASSAVAFWQLFR